MSKVYVVSVTSDNEEKYGMIGSFVFGAFTDLYAACRCAVRRIDEKVDDDESVYIQEFDGDTGDIGLFLPEKRIHDALCGADGAAPTECEHCPNLECGHYGDRGVVGYFCTQGNYMDGTCSNDVVEQ